MDAFYEIIDPRTGNVVQRIAVLTETEKVKLAVRGYLVVRRTLDRILLVLDDEVVL